MSTLLKQAVSKVQKLSKAEQDSAAGFLMDYVSAVQDDIQLSNEQLAEVRRRRAEKNPKTMTLKQLDTRLRKLGA